MLALRLSLPGLLLALSALAPTAASAATPWPAPGPAPSASSSPSVSAGVLDQQVARQQAELDAQDRRLAAATATARDALAAQQASERAAGLATRAAVAEQQELVRARAAVAQARERLDGFAGALYRDGSTGRHLSYLAAALRTGDPAGLLHDVELAEQVGEGRSDAYDLFRSAAARQRDAARRAQEAQARATALHDEALADSAAAQTAVAAQTAIVRQRRAALLETMDAAADAHHREGLLARAEAIALERSRAGIPVSALAGALVPRPTATCTGGDLDGYPNGLLPEAALCPVWGTAGQVLRADAAAAVNDLSRAYAEEHGEPLCVTDSYRDLPEQVAVRAAKPTLAAVPGTSNHGWGVAVDLCGGVEQFDAPAHVWLLTHAAAFGWFHPAWAEPTGAKPEPWHWEYAG